ncbi:MAG: 30S ribosome-binding factor RbfA [Desulfocapsa sp.]|nr:MAG: 30S ribosome-binding factor RbfA [Desulfocapsa sp.]
MIDKSVKLQKTEALIKELLIEAFGALSDPELRGLTVLDVDCSRGKYNAKVFLDEAGMSEPEQNALRRKLRKSQGFLKQYCAEASGWYRSPDFNFKFDDTLKRKTHIDDLFKKIEAELKKGSQ